MDWASTYPIPLLLVGICLRPELLDAHEQAHTVTNFVDAHFLQDGLVHLQQVLSINIIFLEQLFIGATVDRMQPVADTLFVPVLCRIGVVDGV